MMKRAIVACLAVGIAAYATGAWSAAPVSPTEKQLLTRVTKLEKQVKTLQTQSNQLKTTTGNLQGGVGAVALIAACSDLIAADELQATWQVVDQMSAATQAGKTYFGVQTPIALSVGGQDLCQGLGVSRSQVVPPSVAPFQALLGGFTSSGYRAAGVSLKLNW
jgi:hypothetical protein